MLFAGAKEPCVMIDYEQKQYYDTGCKEPRCSLCHFSGPIHFLLHGIPNESKIDRKYIFIPQEQRTQTLEMVGYTGNKIEWNSKDGQWIIRNSINNSNEVVAYLNISNTHLPIGRHVWYRNSKLEQEGDTAMPLKLSKVKL